jgi:hypothetical protein
VDLRCRLVQAELDKAANNSNALMTSAVLHGHEQKFPTAVLRVELERELDELLRGQIKVRERESMLLVEQDGDDDQAEDPDAAADAVRAKHKRKTDAAAREKEGAAGPSHVHLSAAAEAAAAAAADDGFEDDGEARAAEHVHVKRMARRARLRKEGMSTKPVKRYKDVVQKARELVEAEQSMDEATKEFERDFKVCPLSSPLNLSVDVSR